MSNSRKAASFKIFACDDPKCGLHIMALDEKARDLTEIIVGADIMEQFVSTVLELWEDKTGEPINDNQQQGQAR